MKSIIVRVPKSQIVRLFPHLADNNKIITNEELAMFKSGAKLYKEERAGDWRISGYSPYGYDMIKAVAELMDCDVVIKM